MSKIRMSELKDRYVGRAAAVLGGGPSLPSDMEKLPPGCVLIAVNHHAQLLCQPDFMVYNDHPSVNADLLRLVDEGRVTRVSAEPTSDVLFDVDVWTGFYSSNTAAWFGVWLGCDPVILCGMDCYQGDRKYFHPWVDGPHLHQESEHYLRPWTEEGRAKLIHPERVRAMSGPLVEVFGRYQVPGDPVSGVRWGGVRCQVGR